MDNYEKKIREFLDSSEVDQLYKSMLLNLFPEFRENEDEITRKELLEYIKSHPEAPEGHIEKRVLSRWIAWLEKQDEKKRWKPSEEQMNALLHMKSVLVPQNLGPNATTAWVDSLYNDLKKLMD